jgi:hypothetical protein
MTEHIDPQHISDFIKWISINAYKQYGGSTKDYHKMSTEEKKQLSGMAKIVGEAITKGFVLAKKQPELIDAHIRYLESIQNGYTQQILEDMLTQYREFLYCKIYADE